MSTFKYRIGKRFVTRQPCRGSLWAIWDNKNNVWYRLGYLTRRHAVFSANDLNDSQCAHRDAHGMTCLDCGIDLTEHYAARAEYHEER